MKLNVELLLKLRSERSWSQDELAAASGLNLRTVQRIEKDGAGSLQSKKALAAAFDIDPRDLDEDKHMKCPICSSTEIYRYKEGYSLSAEDLLPGLGNAFIGAKIRPSLCVSCGHIMLFTSEEAMNKAKASKHWKAVGG
ncbi:MAG: helix-turn-helix transcriptional regulator [Bauldia sp.]